MCVAVCYVNEKKTIITHFAQPKAALPLQTKSGEIKLITWGRRTGEPGKLPLGGWASLTSIQNGKWDYYLPKPVKIKITKFMEQDIEGRSLWFDVTPGHWLHGLFIQENQEQRVYIVTFDGDVTNNIYSRWPKILCD